MCMADGNVLRVTFRRRDQSEWLLRGVGVALRRCDSWEWPYLLMQCFMML